MKEIFHSLTDTNKDFMIHLAKMVNVMQETDILENTPTHLSKKEEGYNETSN